MQSPQLTDLPAYKSQKHCWPWSEAGDLPPLNISGEIPKISIVTPSFNQGQFIEETIRSVLLQGYPNLEYIIIDGGSIDDSIRVIKKYERWITYWISEPDGGQSHALNKGFSLATGEVFGWLNSDDYFARDALINLMNLRAEKPDSIAWIGACEIVDGEGKPVRVRTPLIGDIHRISNWGRDAWFSQPSCLFDAREFTRVGMIDERLEYVLDVDLWMRLSQRGPFVSTDQIVSYPRKHPGMKTYQNIPSRHVEHLFIDVRHGLRDSALKKFNQYKRQDLHETPYQELAKYFAFRSLKAMGILLNKLRRKIGIFLTSRKTIQCR